MLSENPDLHNQIIGERFQLQVPSLPNWIEPSAEFLRRRAILCGACGESRSGKLLLALHEALANAVIHGNLGLSSDLKERGDDSFARAMAERAADPYYHNRLVDIAVDFDGGRCRWTITDEGEGFDFERVLARPADDPETLLASGRGILMMRSFMDEVRYEQGGRRLILSMTREPTERRQASRIKRHETLQVVPIRPDGAVDWAAAQEGLARNISQQGIGLIQERLARSERVLLGFGSGESFFYVPAQVRRCQAQGGVFELGCSFLDGASASDIAGQGEANASQVQALIESVLGSAAPSSADDRRAHPRVAYTERVEVFTSEGTVVGYARNLSRGGIALVATAPLEPGSAVFALPEGTGVVRVPGRVVRCHRIQAGFFDIGGSFDTRE